MRSSSVFRDEEILSPEFVPDVLPFRESQIRQVADNLQPVGEGRKGQNTFVFGPPGIGKTATPRHVLAELEDEFPGVKGVYVNCWDFNTSIAVLSKITIDLGKFVPRRGLGKDEISQRFLEALGKRKGGVVVCLDEVDQLVFKDPGALYNLLRVNQYIDKELTLVLISNNPHAFAKLESRVLSSLSAEEIEFAPYKIGEMKDILRERAKSAFSSFDEAAVMLAANEAVRRGGDVRVGLQCLQKAGRLAERKGAGRLLTSHVREVVGEVKDARPEAVKKKIGKNEKAIVDIVSRSAPLSFNELYEKYSKKVENPVSSRMVQDYVKHMAQAKMLRLSDKKVGGKRIIHKS